MSVNTVAFLIPMPPAPRHRLKVAAARRQVTMRYLILEAVGRLLEVIEEGEGAHSRQVVP